jgi:hypothetical protein
LYPQAPTEALESDGFGTIASTGVVGSLIGTTGQELILFLSEPLIDDVGDEGRHFALNDVPKDAGLDGLPDLTTGRASDLLFKKLRR